MVVSSTTIPSLNRENLLNFFATKITMLLIAQILPQLLSMLAGDLASVGTGQDVSLL